MATAPRLFCRCLVALTAATTLQAGVRRTRRTPRFVSRQIAGVGMEYGPIRYDPRSGYSLRGWLH